MTNNRANIPHTLHVRKTAVLYKLPNLFPLNEQESHKTTLKLHGPELSLCVVFNYSVQLKVTIDITIIINNQTVNDNLCNKSAKTISQIAGKIASRSGGLVCYITRAAH